MQNTDAENLTEPAEAEEVVEVLDGPPEGADAPEMPPLKLGEPFAMAGEEIDLVDKDDRIPGCFATLHCECGQLFKVNLLTGNQKACPKEGCDQVFTHSLVVCHAEDDEMAHHVFAHVMGANGIDVGMDDDEGDDDQGDDDQGDELPEAK